MQGKLLKLNLLISLILIVIVGLLIAVFLNFPNVGILKSQYPQYRYNTESKTQTVHYYRSKPKDWVYLSQISEYAKEAIVISEDYSFYSHRGFDFGEIKTVLLSVLTFGRVRGASTITQQLAKNAFFSQDPKLWRKLKEVFAAAELEKTYSKDKILEVYLNLIEWGEGVFGIYQASQFYFDKHPSSLSAREGAFLAMLLPNPKRYSQSFRDRKLTQYAKKIVSRILGKMHKKGVLDETQFQFEMNSFLSFEGGAENEMEIPSHLIIDDADSLSY